MKKGVATVAQLFEFDEIIDTRSPAEFAEDRIPGAMSCPVLDNEQRARVGTLYKQVSPFEARRLGGALVAENIARHLLTHFQDKPKNWRPLVYCWRGGQRSGAFVTWMRMIGWDACQLEGGYKAFRHHVVNELMAYSTLLQFRVVCGATGSGKTRLLEALARQGAQVLDLEDAAAHKGSVLGALPHRRQPSQKAFETALWAQMRRFDRSRPVFIEAESRKIGRIHLPEPLIESMRNSPCIAIEANREARLEFLLGDYAYLGDNIPSLQEKIACLKGLQSNETLARWHKLAEAGSLAELFAEFIDRHYDPLYHRSQNRNFRQFGQAPVFTTEDLSPAGLDELAGRLLVAFSPAQG
ncbi:MAG: tRNA 2-selenouridine(34) synthase MnmH [Rhodocyclaceae bacterium]|jgi:tRNA 2-selenouridine synthase|nr:tRNA 2-selenouridine(34) synthase MnmH [Rhodocyclaceae bacterium]